MRTAGDPAQLENAIREQIRMVDADQGISKIEELQQMVSDSIARPRLEATVLTLFGVIALGLASIGLYGLIAFSVAQRAREIGIRMALGASRVGVISPYSGDGLRLTFAGTARFCRVVSATLFAQHLYEIQPS